MNNEQFYLMRVIRENIIEVISGASPTYLFLHINITDEFIKALLAIMVGVGTQYIINKYVKKK